MIDPELKEILQDVQKNLRHFRFVVLGFSIGVLFYILYSMWEYHQYQVMIADTVKAAMAHSNENRKRMEEFNAH